MYTSVLPLAVCKKVNLRKPLTAITHENYQTPINNCVHLAFCLFI